ncbi:MAG: hypothetical protein DRN71_01120 [Candidatus Nanohalarchaeota archaeon]|nr:MAG: hypothetical protein DRN71_01120 [Candidatus Nanohaloarchaeota archaeon]
MYDLLFMSYLVTATLLMLSAWFVYRYSLLPCGIEKYWLLISAGFVVLGAGDFVRALMNVGLGGGYHLILSGVGSVLLLVGFYRLYSSHKV